MSWRRSMPVMLSVAAMVTLAAQQPQQLPPPQQTFRSGTDVVMVDVSVRDGGRNVTGLRAADFLLTDNGVPQQIESVEATAVPIDVTLVVDVSGNQLRPWIDHRLDPAKIAAELEQEVADTVSVLRPSDRIRLLTVDRYVRQIFPLHPKDSRPRIRIQEFDGLGSVFDGLATALLQPVEPARRHVVVARTKGVDALSHLAPAQVLAVASRSDALFHLVMMETAVNNDVLFKGFQCDPEKGMGLCWPVNRFWNPQPARRMTFGIPTQLTPAGEVIKEGAEVTGGGWHQAVLVSVPSLTSTFHETFENFRSSYILRYTPQGVSRAGWHAIQVVVQNAKGRSYSIAARKGYAIEEAAPRPAPPALPTTAFLTTFAELGQAYARGSYDRFVGSLRLFKDSGALLQDLESAGVVWPGTPRREAAFALELAEPGWYAATANTRDRARNTLERVTRQIRQPLEPDDFERLWYFSAIAMMQGAIRPGDTEAFIDRAVDRFPNEPAFRLMRAINTEQKSLADTRVSALAAPGAPRQATVELAQKHYEEAMTYPAAAVEARVRLAWMYYRAGKGQEALALLNTAGSTPIADPFVRYLQQLFLGHVLVTLDKLDDAVAAFRGAVQIAPGAQSGRVALMNALALSGDRNGAQALSEQIQAERTASQDPWWMYWQGFYRVHPQAMARLREAVR